VRSWAAAEGSGEAVNPGPSRTAAATANTAATAIITTPTATSQPGTDHTRSPGNHTNPASKIRPS
jgi:hypothetical protein